MSSREVEFLRSQKDFIPPFSHVFEEVDEMDSSLNFSNFSIDTISRVNPVDISIQSTNEKVMCDATTNTQLTFAPQVHVEFQIIDFPNIPSPHLTPIKPKSNMMESPEPCFISPCVEFTDFKTPKSRERNERYKQLEI